MYNDNNRKLRTVLIVLAIVLVLLRIVKIAKADSAGSIPSSARDYFNDVLEEAVGVIPSDKLTDFNQYVDTCFQQPYIYCFKRTYYSTVYDYFIFTTSSSFGTYGEYGSAFSSPSWYAYTSINDFPTYTIAIQSGGIECITSTYIQYGQFNKSWNTLNWIQYGSRNKYDTIFQFGSRFAMGTTANGNPYDYKSNSEYIAQIIYNASTDYGYTASWQNVAQFPSYTEDSRLKFWTFDNLDGSETLVTDLSEFLQGTDGIMDNQISGLVLTYELDNIEHTLTLDSSNSVIRRSGTATTYRVETPFSAFGFDSSVSAFNITKCDFTLTYTAYGYSTSENYKISCDYSAYKQSSPVEPAPIPSPAVSDPAVDSSVYTFINSVYGSYSSDRYGRSGTWDVTSSEPSDVSIFRSVDVYHFENEEHGSGVDESIYYYSLLDWGNTALDITAYSVFDWDKFISDNTSALYFDVISVPVYHFTPVGQSSTISGRVFDGYALFYTPSYFLRQQYGLLGDILTVVDQDAQNQYNNGIWIVDKINDFEDKTLDALNASLDIDTDSLSWLKTIDNSIKSLDFPVFDDSSILSGLASVVTALSGNGSNELGVNGRLDKLINFFIANDAQKNDSALTYRNWLDGLDPTENVNRRVTHFGTNIYSLVKNIFDIFDADYSENPSFENPDKDYLGIASDFIDALNNIDNSNKFFRGFFDSSFDPLDQSGLPEE